MLPGPAIYSEEKFFFDGNKKIGMKDMETQAFDVRDFFSYQAKVSA